VEEDAKLRRLTADRFGGTSQRKQPLFFPCEGGRVGEGAGDESTLVGSDIESGDHGELERDVSLLVLRSAVGLFEEADAVGETE
jgi:hypothetical protein